MCDRYEAIMVCMRETLCGKCATDMKRLWYESGRLYGENVRRIWSDYGMNIKDFMGKMCDGEKAMM